MNEKELIEDIKKIVFIKIEIPEMEDLFRIINNIQNKITEYEREHQDPS